MKHFVVIFLVALAFISCNNNAIKKPEKPENLISKEKMIGVLYDMSIINAAKGTHKKLLEDNGVNPERYVFNKHGIDSLQFVLSNEYYAFRLDDYKEIYMEVQNKLKKDETYFQRVLDSISNIDEGDADAEEEITPKKVDLDLKLDSLIQPASSNPSKNN